jgi:type II secretory pathway pseudopilin PulG
MSLIETGIAIAVMAITMAIATPSLLRAREIYELQSAARMVQSRMQSARINAVTRNRDCRINVTSSSTYVVECQGTAWETIETVTLPRGFTITASARPEFHERGNVAPTATIIVWDRSLRSLRVIVNVNGRVRIQ